MINSVNIYSLLSTIDLQHHSLDTIMYYGWEHCGFFPIKKEISAICESGNCIVKKHFDWKLSSPELCQQDPKLNRDLKGKEIHRVVSIGNSANASNDRSIRIQLCKATLVNIVFENASRSLHNLPLIPVFFGIDIVNNPYPTTSYSVCSKDSSLNDKITHKELRRAYKLCFDPRLSKEIHEIAQKTFIFLKILPHFDGVASFIKIDSIWLDSNWTVSWKSRKALSKPKINPPTQDWRKCLMEAYEKAAVLRRQQISRQMPLLAKL